MLGDVAVAAVGPSVGGAPGDGEEVLGAPHDGERVVDARRLGDGQRPERGLDEHDHVQRRQRAYLLRGFGLGQHHRGVLGAGERLQVGLRGRRVVWD